MAVCAMAVCNALGSAAIKFEMGAGLGFVAPLCGMKNPLLAGHPGRGGRCAIKADRLYLDGRAALPYDDANPVGRQSVFPCAPNDRSHAGPHG